VSDVALEGIGISKAFMLPHEVRNTFKEYFLHPLRRLHYERNEALTDVDITVRKGEFFGVIGANGSGKSTLLKILAGIYQPDVGTVRTYGKLSPFIELGVGFNADLSGRENVRINGTLLGLTKRELEEKFDSIIEFAELGRFVDQKLKNYSTGMTLRLAYSIAVQVPFDILLLDEVLAVGDRRFAQKCFATFERFREERQTVVYVSHDLESVVRWCDRALYLDGGRVAAMGDPDDVINEYRRRSGVVEEPAGPTATALTASMTG
jgi:ABC-type polysaccharide/polyol phosphate transport system ATPase subunit